MGAYKFSIYFKIQFGLIIGHEDGFHIIDIPFVRFMYSTDRYASGCIIFGEEFN